MNKIVNFKAPEWFVEKIEEEANKQMLSKSDIIRKALNEYFENHKED